MRVEKTGTLIVTGVIVSTEGHILVGDGFGMDDASIWGDKDMKVHLSDGRTDQLPGEQLTVRLSDGRDADAVALGTNPITDIGLVKITTLGSWPFAEIDGGDHRTK